MLRILSRVARKLGLLAVHVTVVREKSGSMRVIESTFPLSPPIEIDVHISLPYDHDGCSLGGVTSGEAKATTEMSED